MGQEHEKHMRLQPEASHLDHRLAEVCLGMARWMIRRHGRFAPRQALLADVVFDDGVAAVEAVLVAQAFENPLCRRSLLGRDVM